MNSFSYKHFFSLIIFLLFFHSNLFGFVRDVVESVKIIHVNSIKQTIKDFNKVILEGDVEILIDQKIKIWADRVEIDQDKQFFSAEKIILVVFKLKLMIF